jgi:hypothetical protein
MDKDKINLPSSPSVKKTTFVGSPKMNYKVLKYLQKKFKENCCVIIPPINYKYNDYDHNDISLRWTQVYLKKGYFSIPKNYWNIFKKCDNDKRFIVFPFGFNCLNKSGHANYMIYDKTKKTLERFEPYGKSARICANPVDLDKKIKNLFKENLGDDFVKRYYKPLDFMPENSFQNIQEKENKFTKDDPDGFCAAWSCWYAELRLLNPDKDRKKIVELALQNLEKESDFTSYIRGYSMTIF